MIVFCCVSPLKMADCMPKSTVSMVTYRLDLYCQLVMTGSGVQPLLTQEGPYV